MFVLYVFFLYAGRQLYVIFDWNRAIPVDYCSIFAKILISVAMVTKMIIIKNKNIFSCSYIITFLWYQNQPNWLTIMWSHLHDFYLNRHLIFKCYHIYPFYSDTLNSISFIRFYQVHSGPQIRVHNGFFFYFSTKTYVMGTQKNRLNETYV